MVPRIERVSPREAGLGGRLAYWFTRRAIGKLAGVPSRPERMIAPLELYAHVPELVRGYTKLEQATAKLRRLDRRSRALAELKAATLTHCAYCIDLGSRVARRWGLSDEQLLALPAYATSPLFDERDRLVLDYAVAISSTPVTVSDALVGGLREHFDDPQLVELTHVITLENLRGRFNLALGVEAAGFSHDTVCAVPESAASLGSPPGTP